MSAAVPTRASAEEPDRSFPYYRPERAQAETLTEAHRLIYLDTRISNGIATDQELEEAKAGVWTVLDIRAGRRRNYDPAKPGERDLARERLRTAHEALRSIRGFGPGAWES